MNYFFRDDVLKTAILSFKPYKTHGDDRKGQGKTPQKGQGNKS